jgi:glycogen debranching enzyme
VYPDGRLAPLPRATCEIQGYAYAARCRTAALAREVWSDRELADRLERDAAVLREAFNRDFWLPDRDYYALALDGDKHPVPTMTSNPGQLLWSGIVPADRVDAMVAHLFGPALYSGWGVRTLATGQPAYNPFEYHNGTVWPHDNAMIAEGLRRYGRRAEADRIVTDQLAAAERFDFTLPELFAGVDRGTTPVPVPYPHAGAPQAWATTAPLLLVRVMLGLDPGPARPVTHVRLPEPATRLALHGVPGHWGRADVPA